METKSKTLINKEIVSVPTFFEVVSNYSFAKEDKNLEIEWIDQEIAFASQHLMKDAAILQKETIATLMNLITKLNLKKDFILGNLQHIDTETPNNLDDNPAWRLHKKSQSGFELKA